MKYYIPDITTDLTGVEGGGGGGGGHNYREKEPILIFASQM